MLTRRFLRTRKSNFLDREDFIQDVWFKIYNGKHSFLFENKYHLYNWVNRRIFYTYLDTIRSLTLRALKKPQELNDVHLRTLFYVEEERVDFLSVVKNKFDDAHFQTFKLHLEGYNLRETGEQLGVSYQTVKNKLEVVFDYLKDYYDQARSNRVS